MPLVLARETCNFQLKSARKQTSSVFFFFFGINHDIFNQFVHCFFLNLSLM